MNVTEALFALRDTSYAAFQANLLPTIPRATVIGVRVPQARALAKQLANTTDEQHFLKDLPHTYYDENILHAVLLSEMKTYEACVAAVDAFLPYVDNWAVCDILSPKSFKPYKQTHEAAFLAKIKSWTASEETYTRRFGIEMLMTHFLDKAFKPDYLDIPVSAQSDEYYVRMMIGWFFATALAKQWDATIPYIENRCLDAQTHNKVIQKARESNRISAAQKEYLKTLKWERVQATTTIHERRERTHRRHSRAQEAPTRSLPRSKR